MGIQMDGPAMVVGQPVVVATNAGAPIWVGNQLMTPKASGRETGGAYALIESIELPHGGPPLHRHEREDEAFYVLEGEFLFQCDGHRFAASAGTFVHLPRGTAHAFTNTGEGLGRLLVLVTPAGAEEFFAEVGQPGTSPASPPPPPTPAQMEHLATTARRYGIEIMGPPLG